MDISNGVDIISSMALQADGKIIVAGASGAGTYTYKRIVARYNSDGSLDPSFGSGWKGFRQQIGRRCLSHGRYSPTAKLLQWVGVSFQQDVTIAMEALILLLVMRGE